jgi:hypothetical protein
MSVIELEEKLSFLRAERDVINTLIASIHKELKQEMPQPKNTKNMLFPIVRDYNCAIGPHASWADDIFGDISGKKKVHYFEKADIFDILVVAGAFESKGQARKNWQGIKEIPTGYNEIGPIGKQKLMLFIWNPTE